MDIWIWLILVVLFLILEAATVTMTTLWFAAGAWAALLVAALGGALWLQIVVAIAVSALMLAGLRPMVKKHFTPKLTPTNVDAVIGTKGYVTTPIDNMAATGTVKLGAMEWTARSSDDTVISAGTLVRVDKIEGVKVIVSPAETLAEV